MRPDVCPWKTRAVELSSRCCQDCVGNTFIPADEGLEARQALISVHDSRVASPVATFSGPSAHPIRLLPHSSSQRCVEKANLISSSRRVSLFLSPTARLDVRDHKSLVYIQMTQPLLPTDGSQGRSLLYRSYPSEAGSFKSSVVFGVVLGAVNPSGSVSAASRPSPLSPVASSSAGSASKRAILSPACSFLLHLTREAT